MTRSSVDSLSRLLVCLVVSLATVSATNADEKSWKDETLLVSPQGDRIVARAPEGEEVLFENADPQLTIEWALANARTTVVLAGEYLVAESVDIPRDGVTLLIAPRAKIALDPKTEHTTDIGFRPAGSHHLVPLIYNKGRKNVRVIHLGSLVHTSWPDQKPPKQTFPIVFDGRNEQRTCGVEGGMLLVAGGANQSFVLLDVRNVQVPLVVLDATSRMDAVLTLEGCENCNLGTLINLAPDRGGHTGETVDLNSSNQGIRVERLIGERPQEIIDCNASHVDVRELICVGKPRKLLCFTVGSGPRWTSRPRAANRLDVWNAEVLEDAADVSRRIEVPDLPAALPRFTVRAIVEVTLEGGAKKEYVKEVVVDIAE